MTTQEIRTQAFRVIDNIITLKTNVFAGCRADRAELEKQLPRLEQIKKWAIENDQLPEIKNYFSSKNFGQARQFAANEVKKVFFN